MRQVCENLDEIFEQKAYRSELIFRRNQMSKYKIGMKLRVTVPYLTSFNRGEETLILSLQRYVKLKGSKTDWTYTTLEKCFEIVEDPCLITIPTKTHNITLTQDEDGVAVITCGCFTGTVIEALNLAKQKARPDYLHAVRLLREIATDKSIPIIKPKPVRKPKLGEVWRQSKHDAAVAVVHVTDNRLRWVGLTDNKVYEPFEEHLSNNWEFVASNLKEYYLS